MTTEPLFSQAMTTTVGVDEGVALVEAARSMAYAEVGLLVVSGSNGPVGVLSQQDIVQAIADGADIERAQVREYMTTPLISIPVGATVQQAAVAMHEHGVRHLPLVAGGRVVGMVSARDVLRVLARDAAQV